MSVNLKNAMHAAALAESLGDTEARATGVLSNTRPTTSRIRHRRTARQAGTSVVGVAAVAAIVVGGSALKAHVHAAGMPNTALSKRAGAVCGQPFDPAGKSDPRFTSRTMITDLSPDKPPTMIIVWTDDVELSRPTYKAQRASAPTVVVLQNGIVVGITETITGTQLTDVLASGQLTHPSGTPDPADLADNQQVFVMVNETMNCTGTVPSRITANMFDLVVLTEFRVAGDPETALVIAPPVKGPSIYDDSVSTPADQQTADAATWDLVTVGETDTVRGEVLGFKIGDYLAVKDTPGANVPLYPAKDGWVPPGTAPYSGPAEAHASGNGSIIITLNGVKVTEQTEQDMSL